MLVNILFSGCGGILDIHSSQEFTSPNYPSRYLPGTVCDWVIRAEYGNTIELTIESFDFASSNDCRFDGLYISNSFNFENESISRICHHTDGTIITSNGHELVVRFQADLYEAAKGFKASFQIIPEGI